MKLIEHWRSALNFWSVRLGILGTAIAGYLTAFPDAALYAWSLMPPDLKTHIPPRVLPLVGIGIFGISLVARIVKQPKLEKKLDEKGNP